MTRKNRVLTLAITVCALLLALPFTASALESDQLETVEISGTVDLFQCGSLTGNYTMPNEAALLSAEDTIEQQVYDQIYEALQAKQETITIVRTDLEITQENLNSFCQMVLKQYETVVNDNPQLFYVSGNCSVSGSGNSTGLYVYLVPSYLEDVTSEKIAAFQQAVEEAKAQVAGVTDDVEKMLILHDYLVLKNAYNWEVATTGTSDDKLVWSAYAALVQGDPVCQGYALAYKLLLNELGINCITVTSLPMHHMWNMVEIDGSWYHVDVTWDDATPNTEGRCKHTYFLLCDNDIYKEPVLDETGKVVDPGNHYGWDEDAPACTSDTYESGWVFNSSNSNVYLRGGKFYYVNLRYELYKTDALDDEGTKITLLSNSYHSGYGFVWNNGYVYYVPYTSAVQKTLQACSLDSGAVEEIGTFNFTATAAAIYQSVSDCIGLRYNASSGQIEVVSSTRREVLYSASLQAEQGKTEPLAVPTELQWGKFFSRNGTQEWTDIPGAISWKLEQPTQNRYSIRVYKVEADGADLYIGGTMYELPSNYTNPYFSDFTLATHIEESGSYYYTIQSCGDGINYSDSAVATSTVWEYTKPAAKLDTPSAPAWDGRYMTWTPSADTDYIDCCEIQVFYGDTADAEPRSIGSHWSSEQVYLANFWFERYGDGYYYFRVRSISSDMTVICNSEWSELSEAYAWNEASEKVREQLQSIVDDLTETSSEEEIQEAIASVKTIDPDQLSAAMAADQDNSGTVKLLQDLEKAAGMTAGVTVDDAMADVIAGEQVTVVGAALNAADSAESVTLQIGNADAGVVIPEQYNNAVQFSMHLEGAEDADPDTGNQQLAIPVKIILPVPANINPAFLVILHYHEDNQTYEEIHPYIYREEDGQWFASFVVTSFSSFALAENASAVANESGDGILVSMGLTSEITGKSIAAAYDENGKLLGTGFLDGSGQCEIRCDAARAATVKVFLLDETNAPVFQAAEIHM